jgi:Tol biopolymer transport system component
MNASSGRFRRGLGVLALCAAARAPFAAAHEAIAPELVAPGVVSTGDFEQNFSLTPDGQTAFFAKVRPDLGHSVILLTRWRNERWSEPEIAPFSGRHDDTDPFVSPDGRRVFFISKRAAEPSGAPRKDWDVWVVERREDGFGPPRRLGPNVNTTADELYPSVTRRGTLYFSSERSGGLGHADLYRAQPEGDDYGPAYSLTELNSPLSEHDAYVDPDERYLIFIVRGAPEGLGGADLFVSRREGERFAPRRALKNPLNSPGWDWCPSVSPDGRWFYFSSSRVRTHPAPASYQELIDQLRGPGNGHGDVYRVPFTELGLLP